MQSRWEYDWHAKVHNTRDVAPWAAHFHTHSARACGSARHTPTHEERRQLNNASGGFWILAESTRGWSGMRHPAPIRALELAELRAHYTQPDYQ
jgi:hypothetical protein